MDTEALLRAYVRGIMQRDGINADDVRPVAAAVGAVTAIPSAVSAADITALRKVQQDEPLNPSEVARIQAIVLPNGLRPAFDIAADGFADVPEPWSRLNARRDALRPVIRAVGRVDLRGHPERAVVGTGFVVGADLLLTNRHVAELFVNVVGGGTQLTFSPGITAAVDLKQEVASTDVVALDVVAPALVLNTWDAALLRVSGVPADLDAIRLAAAAPAAVDGSALASVVGYPMLDQASDFIQQINIYRGIFDKKRLMPGRLMGMRTTISFGRDVLALAHDCTTLGGNSGSAVIDIESGLVVGLHFGGEHLVANYAVPTWEMASDARMRDAGVLFA